MTNGAIFHKAQENAQNNSTNQQSVYNCQGGSSHHKLLLFFHTRKNHLFHFITSEKN